MRQLLVLSAFAALFALPPSGPAIAQDAKSLLFLSAEATDGSNYWGLGWMRAPRGLDRSGPVVSVEAGRPLSGGNRVAALIGWRIVAHRIYATGLVGIDWGDERRPTSSIDLWWDRERWMATARGQFTKDSEDTLRAAAGWRLRDDMTWVGGAWIGPEISSTWQGTRYGIHMTGLRLPQGIESRVSAGVFDDGQYFELSLWRRF